jgi:hypothetical protein
VTRKLSVSCVFIAASPPAPRHVPCCHSPDGAAGDAYVLDGDFGFTAGLPWPLTRPAKVICLCMGANGLHTDAKGANCCATARHRLDDLHAVGFGLGNGQTRQNNRSGALRSALSICTVRLPASAASVVP